MKLNKGYALVLWLLVAILFVATAVAQETTAGLQGVVKDPQGAVVSKATVEVTSPALIGAKKTETDASGYYRFANLPPGSYTITVTAQGFRTLKRSAVDLTTGALPTIDLKMEIGGIEQTVEVSSAAPIVDVTQSKVQTNVTAEEIVAIPKGRSFQSLIQLAPGARQEPLMGNGYQIDGASNAENTYLVEGQDTGNIQTGFSAANVPMEFIQEVQIKSGGFEAEYGGALGGVINVIQKRGSNAWHGSIFTYYTGDMFNAAPNRRIRYVPGAPVTFVTDVPVEYWQPKKDSYRTVEPGFEAGGYLKRDRLWLFTSFVPQINHLSRTANWNFVGTTGSNAVTVQGPRTFSQDINTYYALTRADYLVSQKIRVYGAWQDQYQTQKGVSLPFADPVNPSQVNPNATQNPDNFNSAIGAKYPNVIYNAGADITLTPSLVATTRYGYFYTDHEDRGFPIGNFYQWNGAVSASRRSLAPGAVGYNNGSDCSGATDCAYRMAAGTALPTNVIQPSGYSTIGNPFTVYFDKYWRKSFNQDLAWFKKGFLGTHNIKGGYALNKLSNDVFEEYNTARLRLSYHRAYTAAGTAQVQNCDAINAFNNTEFGTAFPGSAPGDVFNYCGGLYGYVNARDINTKGKVGSDNHALYIQDAWTPGAGLTLNLGIRADKEAIPNYLGALSNFQGISFGFADKVAPRLGASWDVLRNGKFKIYGSFGYFFDIMKYEMPRGSFGGDWWHDCIYALDNPDYTLIKPQKQLEAGGHNVYCGPGGATNGGAYGTGFSAPMTGTNPHTGLPYATRPNSPNGGVPGLIANVDFRKPSNDITDFRVDPNLKPMKQHEMTVGADWAINNSLSLETRYTRKRLDRTIEDAGYLDETGSEPFYIVNPGEGIHKFGNVPLTDCPVGECKQQPKAVRNYDGLEFRLTRKATAHWYGVLSYTYSRLYGNYGGLTSAEVSDGGTAAAPGGGRASPNVSRSFDEPMMQFDSHGNQTFGLLPTDRPHTIKGFGYYRVKWFGMETLLGATQLIYSGTPLSSFVNVSNNAFVPMFVEGRGKWIDISFDPNTLAIAELKVRDRRTPTFTQSDLNFVHELKVSKTHEQMRLGFEANVVNLFNQHAATAFGSQITDDFCCAIDPALHVPASTVSGFDYPTMLKYGFNWVDEFNNEGMIKASAYGLEQAWQNPRSFRFKIKFTF